MDLTPIILAAVKPMLWTIPFLIIIGLLKSPFVKGIIGEAVVKFLARIKLPKNVYIPLHNVTLPTSDGTTQIDHIFVSEYGIFVVETKNMKGWIFGGENQAQWTQQIYKVKNKFQNPIRQNYKHIKTLEASLEIPPNAIKSVIAFTGNSTFKSDMPDNVTYGIGYARYIKSFTTPILTDEQVKYVVNRIESGRLEPSRATDKEHIRQLKSNRGKKEERDCPKCGKPMVLRLAKKGANCGNKFWGCSGYPACRTVQELT